MASSLHRASNRRIGDRSAAIGVFPESWIKVKTERWKAANQHRAKLFDKAGSLGANSPYMNRTSCRTARATN
jgi:hypothetical protein